MLIWFKIMTSEEVKQLKEDDEIFIRAKYVRTLYDGDVIFYFPTSDGRGNVTTDERYAHPSCVIFPPPAPKYDPCRKFRKGDRVRVVEWSGRNPVLPFMDCKVGDIGTVIKDEETTSFFVRLHLEGKYEKDMPYCHLELVMPVEELEPYYMKETASVYEVFNRNENNSSVAIFFKSQYSIEKAKERAEAECARLNAEYRKEQNNG